MSNNVFPEIIDVNVLSPDPLPVSISGPDPLPVSISSPDPLPVSISSPLPLPVDPGLAKTAFRDLAVTQSTLVHEGSAQYGILKEVIATAALGGTAVATNSLFSCESGTSVDGFGAIALDGALAFRPGQGEKDLFSARFSDGEVGSEQFAGAINTNAGAGWGYNGVDFGILVRAGGAIEIQELTITTQASGAENATVTIDGTGYTVPLTSGTVQDNATEIADSLTAQVPLWEFQQVDNQVIVTSFIATPSTGAFTFTSATAVAAFSLITTGVLPTDNWINQADWNGDPIAGLVPSFINSYMIQFGPSVAFFSIFDPVTSEYIVVHTINLNNSSEEPLIDNPTFGHSWYALNRTGTTNVITEGGFAGLYREGKNIPPNTTDSIQIGKSAGTTLVPLFSIRGRNTINGVINEASALLRGIQVATDATKPMFATLIGGGVLTGENWQYKDKSNSILLVDTSATAVTGGEQLAITGFQAITSTLNARIRRGDTFTLAVNVSSGGAADFSGVLTYLEDL